MKVSNSFQDQIKDIFIKDTSDPVAILDKDLKFLSFSENWLSAHKIQKLDIIDEYFFNAMPNFPLSFKPILENCLTGKKNENLGENFLLDNGKHIWLKWNISPWTNKENTIGGLIVVLENISVTNNMAALLEDAQEVSRTGGWEVNLITNKVIWTKMVNIIHEQPLDFAPKNFDECFIHFKQGKYRDKVYAAAERAINKGIPWDEEVKMVTEKGKEIWIRTKGQAEFLNGKCVRIFGICQDINQFKLDQLKYRESAEQLKKAVTASNVGTWEYHLNNGLTIWDDICYKLHGIDKNNLKHSLYRSWKNAVHPEDIDSIKEAVSLYYKGIGVENLEYRVILPDNTVRNIKAIITFITDPESTVYKAIGIAQDVTKEKIAEKKLQEFASITGEQNNSLTNFAHMVSHDLRAHSTNLSVLTSLLLDEKSEEERKQILEMLKSATNSLNSTVVNLNEVVQSNNAEIKDKLISVNLLEAITTVQNNIATQFKEKKAICVIDITPDQMVTVVPAYLDSILLNLFTNSLKYCSPSRLPVIKITSRQNESGLELIFVDNGKGIDLQKFGKTIFGMNKTFHRNKDARGVGLYITKNQIEAMGGSISVTSKVNTGTTFILNFKT